MIDHEKVTDVLKGLTVHVTENADRKVTDREKEIVVLKGLTVHAMANADRTVIDREKEIVLDRWKVVDRHSSACLIKTRMDGCQKMNSPRPPNYSMSLIAITTASWIQPSCLADRVAQADRKVDHRATETRPVGNVTSLVRTLHAAMLHDAKEPREVIHRVVKGHLTEVDLLVNDGLMPNGHGAIASQGQKQIVNGNQLRSSNAWIAMVTEKSPRKKLQKR